MTKDTQAVIGQYLETVKKWWWLLVASVLVASASSYVAVSRAPHIYQATTTVLVGQSLQKTNPTYQDFSISQQLALTYINMVQRQPILQAAAEALGLSYVPWYENVSARLVPGTQLIEISVRDTSPELARALADEIAHQLILQTPSDSRDRQQQEFVQEQLQRLQDNIRETTAEIKEEQARLDAATSARAIQQYQDNIAALQQKLTTYESGYTSLLLTVEGDTNYISVFEPATTPFRPISPQVMETVLLAAAVGLALALGGAFLIEFLDDTVKTADDLARVTDLPLLGAISRISGDSSSERLIVRRDPRSPLAESFRALRTNIQFASLDRPMRTLMVTSSDPMEGKSFVIANLAVAIAQGGSSVLLVDADLRRPTQHLLFGLVNDHGLSDALLEPDPDLSTYGQKVDIKGLSWLEPGGDESDGGSTEQYPGTGELRVITCGRIPPNPNDLLALERTHVLLRKLESQADMVLIDAPPVMAVTDAVMLSTRVSGVLVVNDAEHTRRARIQRTLERLRQVNANLLGIILNRVSPRSEGYYSYGYYYYAQDDDPRERGSRGKGKMRKLAALLGLGGASRRSRGRGKSRQPVNPAQAAQQQAPSSSDGRGEQDSGEAGDHCQEPDQLPKGGEPQVDSGADSV